ncbi:hypothetical protein ACFLYW_00225 [Thermodesulfobacteriota bacterium]
MFAQRNEPKKGQPFTWSRVSLRDYPALLEMFGSLKTHPPEADSNKSKLFSEHFFGARLHEMAKQKNLSFY